MIKFLCDNRCWVFFDGTVSSSIFLGFLIPKIAFVAVSSSVVVIISIVTIHVYWHTGFHFYAHYWVLHYIQTELSKDSAVCEKTCGSNALVSAVSNYE